MIGVLLKNNMVGMFSADHVIFSECVEGLKKVPDGVVDCTIFSPPYDKIRDYKGFSIDFSQLGKEIYRVFKDGAVCCVVINDGTKDFCKSLTTFRLAVDWVDNAEWKLFETLIYSRFGRPGAWWNKRFRVDHEYILVFFKGKKPKYFNKKHLFVPAKHAGETWHGTTRLTDGTLAKNEKKVQAATKCRGTIWHYKTSNTEGNRIKLKHPATYPDKLASDLIKCFSKEGDLILDPTVGSGTTVVMASQLKRHYLGFDISEDYVNLANERLATETCVNQPDMFAEH